MTLSSPLLRPSVVRAVLGTTAVLVALPNLAAAGGSTGNGGGAIVCRDAQNVVVARPQLPTGATLLDLWLAETLPRYSGKPLEIVRTSYSWEWQVKNMLYQIYKAAPGFYAALKPEVDDVEPDFKDPLHILDIKQDRIYDSDDFLAPVQCNREQVVHYNGDTGAIITKSIWDALPPTDRAALVLHEAIYKLYREYFRSESSDDAQQVVAQLFSRTLHESVLRWMQSFKAFRSGPAQICVTGDGKLDDLELSLTNNFESYLEHPKFQKTGLEYCAAINLRWGLYDSVYARHTGKSRAVEARIIQYGISTEVPIDDQGRTDLDGRVYLRLKAFFVPN